MGDRPSLQDNPLYWPVEMLLDAYARRDVSPVEVLELALARIDSLNPTFNAFLGRLDGLAREQAEAAEKAYRNGNAGALCGVPVSIKDTFQIAGQETTFGSLLFRGNISSHDCGVVARLRAAGAVFTGRTNTAEFGQSATTENRFFDDVCNPWDTARTAGGSSGGAAASVIAGLSSLALGADGGGSIRIPAAFCGLFGLKPTYGLCSNEQGLAAMSDFVCPGPISWRVADARRLLGVLANRNFERKATPSQLRIAWNANPEGRPTESALDATLRSAVDRLADAGYRFTQVEFPIEGWKDVFGPLVLAEEKRERGHLLDSGDALTDYERKTLQAAERVTDDEVENARHKHERYRHQIQQLFAGYDFVVTPTTAAVSFPIGSPPRSIDGQHVSRTWGAYPFTAPFNVSGNPAATLPCGLADNLPVGLQIVAPHNRDAQLLDVAEHFECVLQCDRSSIIKKWSRPPADHAHTVRMS